MCVGVLEEKLVPITHADHVAIDVCWACSGIWLDEGEMQKIWDLGLEKIAPFWVNPADANVQKKDAKCPKCNVPLQSVRNVRDPRILQDLCPECFGVWLDGGELGLLQRGGPVRQLLDALTRWRASKRGQENLE